MYMEYGTILTWGLFNGKWCVHEGDHINAIPHCFSLGLKKERKKERKKEMFQGARMRFLWSG